MIDIIDKEQRKKANDLLNIVATYRKSEDLINIDAYIKGSNPEIDYAIKMIDSVNSFLKQDINDGVDFKASKEDLFALCN
jgi:flagellum-specific ATP synthase